ncbi:MAG TPA: hypothetical protein VFO21_08905 [Vicinamibacterales bacterium]|nr:hypothetical protein [Vicinamibacterales bacterium]
MSVTLRFGVVYLTLFCLASQISGSLIPNPWFTYRGLGRLWPMRDVTHWVARTFFGVDVPLDDVSGGETLFFWIQWSWLLVASVVTTAVWSLRDRRRGYAALHAWGWLAVRVLLAASMLEYGMTKVIPTQFPAPPLTALVTPAGEMTLSALLWTTIGSAPAYQIATGCVEVLAGVLLLLPRTVPLGALLALVSMVQVLLLNLTFDIGVKLVTAHLIVLALMLLVPAIRMRQDTTLEVRLKAPAIGRVLLVVLGVYLLATQAWINWKFWQVGGGGRPKSVLYGIWNVERLSLDGQARPAELNDYDRRWRRVIFDAPGVAVFQRTDDSFARYGVSIDQGTGTLALTKGGSRAWGARFTFDRTSDGGLRLDGEMDGHRIQADLQRVDPSAFPLLNSGFRWVRPHDP